MGSKRLAVAAVKRPWMPFYVADYFKDTRHLTRAQHGSYVLLILEYWTRGSLPQDEEQLARLAAMTPGEWKAERSILAAMFEPEWKHKRIEDEMARVADVAATRRRAANVRHAKGANVVHIDEHR